MVFKKFLVLAGIAFSIGICVLCNFPSAIAGQTESDAATAKFMPNVVQLMVTFSDQSIEHGFGFVVGERDNQLYVLTANHVVRKSNPNVSAQSIKATFCAYQAKQYSAELSPIYNQTRDFAVLIVSKPSPDYQWARESYDPTPERSEQVWFIGRSAECYVPATNGVIEKEDNDIKGKFSVIYNQVQPGTSGAPLISKQGIVGLITTDSLDGVSAVSLETIRPIVVEKGVPWDLQKSGEIAASTPAVPSAGEPVPSGGNRLRNTPITVAKKDSQKTFGLDGNWRPLKYIQHNYEDRGDVIIDHATGLMWDKSGSDGAMPYDQAKEYAENLTLAGYTDWRLPTVAELMSLIEPQKLANNLRINPIFDPFQSWCWTMDLVKNAPGANWRVDFDEGNVYSETPGEACVRAVRSVK